ISNASFNGDSNTTTYTYTRTIGPDLVTGETIVVGGMTDPNNDGTFTNISVGSGTFTVSNTLGSSSTGAETGSGTVSNGVCNTAKTICANPDSGFLTVTNDTGSPFSGTISLTGTSSSCGSASDSSASGLTTSGAGQSVTLALGAPGTTLNPTE